MDGTGRKRGRENEDKIPENILGTNKLKIRISKIEIGQNLIAKGVKGLVAMVNSAKTENMD